MAMNIIYGVYHFLGFHLSDYFLRKGEEVIGIDSEPDVKSKQEEMKEFYGRNSNFHHQDKDIFFESSLEKVHVYIVLWDVQELKPRLLAFLKQIGGQAGIEADVTVFLSLHTEGKHVQSVKDACEEHPSLQINKWIYIEQLYGPWMPLDSTIYELVKNGEYDQLENEHLIFIDDFISGLDSILHCPDEILVIESARSLEEEAAHGKLRENVQSGTIFQVPVLTSLSEGVGKILNHDKKWSIIEQWNNN